jgi:DNA-directed RNA polymerase II subunit RPB2
MAACALARWSATVSALLCCVSLSCASSLLFSPLAGIIGHGASQVLKERLFAASDAYRVHLCDSCGLIAVADLNKNVFECRGCQSQVNISQIHIPYACKVCICVLLVPLSSHSAETQLLFQELMSMLVAPRLMTSTDGPALR